MTILGAPDDTEVLVLEMGMRGLGEIARLCAVARPDIGVVTAVAAAHTERSAASTASPGPRPSSSRRCRPTGTAILNADDARVAAMAARDRRRGGHVRRPRRRRRAHRRPRARRPAPGRASRRARRGATCRGRAGRSAARTWRRTPPPPSPSPASSASTSAPAADGARPAPSCRRCGCRSCARRAGGVVINDAYNANPTSMAAALDALGADRRRPAGRRARADGRARRPGRRPPRRSPPRPASSGIELIAVGTDRYGVAPVDRRRRRAVGQRRRRRRRARQGQPCRSGSERSLRGPAWRSVGDRSGRRAPAAASEVAPAGQADGDDGAEAEHPAGADGVDHRAEEQVADRHRAAERHEPQRHHDGPLGVGQVLLEDRDQRRRREEVGEAEDERHGERRAEACGRRRRRPRLTANSSIPSTTSRRRSTPASTVPTASAPRQAPTPHVVYSSL